MWRRVWLRFARAGSHGGGSPPARSCVELQRVRNALESVLDLRAEDEEDGDNADGDQSKQNAVLGHRLALFAAQLDLCQLKPIAEYHVRHLPSAARGAGTVGQLCGGAHGFLHFDSWRAAVAVSPASCR